MTSDKPRPHRPSTEELLEEGEKWERGELSPGSWSPADGAAPRASESRQVNIRLPTAMLTLLKAFAAREGVGYQVLLKRWLDDRLAIERDRLRRGRHSMIELPEVADELGRTWEDIELKGAGAVRRRTAA